MQDSWNYSPNTNGAGIWMSGGGPAFDGTEVYFSTGNNLDNDGAPIGYSNSILQVNPYSYATLGLGQIHQFLPSQANGWIGADADLGSSRVIVVPGTNYAIVAGKAGNIYAIDTSAPISSGASQRGAFNVLNLGLNHNAPLIYAGFAYWNNTIYAWGDSDVLRSFSLSEAVGGSSNPLLSQGDVSGYPNNEQAAVVSVSSNYDTNGLVWTVKLDGDVHQFSPGELRVYDATNLSSALFTAPLMNPITNQPDDAMKFTAPLVANGRVYIVTMSEQILVYSINGQ